MWLFCCLLFKSLLESTEIIKILSTYNNDQLDQIGQ